MQLSVKSLAITAGIVWGGVILLTGIASIISPGYGTAMLEVMASLYPGYHVGGLGSVFVGTLYGVLDGVIVGAVFAWLYNKIAGVGAAA